MKTSAIKNDREMIQTQSRQPLLGQARKLNFQLKGNKKNLLILDEGSLLFGHVKEPPTMGMSMSPCSKMVWKLHHSWTQAGIT